MRCCAFKPLAIIRTRPRPLKQNVLLMILQSISFPSIFAIYFKPRQKRWSYLEETPRKRTHSKPFISSLSVPTTTQSIVVMFISWRRNLPSSVYRPPLSSESHVVMVREPGAVMRAISNSWVGRCIGRCVCAPGDRAGYLGGRWLYGPIWYGYGTCVYL